MSTSDTKPKLIRAWALSADDCDRTAGNGLLQAATPALCICDLSRESSDMSYYLSAAVMKPFDVNIADSN